ncbi:hypothetical protein LP420_39735 [Massilia sp. B-10]|nr:hypothetical protein LP420_39735 [Massilia sp. B-10]
MREGAANVAEAMTWLRERQTGDGFWTDNQFTTMRDTAVVFDTLFELDGGAFAGRLNGMNWLRAQNTSNTDYLARQIRSLSGAGARPDELAARLVALQNSDGGWGVAARYQSNPVDTALAIQALLPFEATVAAKASWTRRSLSWFRARTAMAAGAIWPGALRARPCRPACCKRSRAARRRSPTAPA